MPKKIPKYLKKKEALLLLNSPYKTDVRDYMLMLTILKIGVRSTESTNLKVLHFDFAERKVLIENGKGGKDRLVPFDMEYSGELRQYIEQFDLKADDVLFDISRRQVHNIISGYGKKAKLDEKVYPHKLRHTYAVFFLKEGGNLRTLQKNMGHSSLTTTQIYLDITEEDRGIDVDKHSTKLVYDNKVDDEGAE